MQSRQHDGNATASVAAAAPSVYLVDVVVLTSDAGLLETLRNGSGPEHSIWPAQSTDAAVELLVGGRCGILIADLQVLRSDATALLSRLQQQFPELVLLVTGRREEEAAVAALISSGCIYRFLHKPVSPARANLFINAATRRYNEISNVQSAALATARHFAQSKHRTPLIATLAGVVALALLLLWFLQRPDASPPPTHAENLATAPPSMPQVADHLAAAQLAFAAGRVSTPPGDNALDHYRNALAMQNDNSAALSGVQKVIDLLTLQVTKALASREAPEAAIALAALQKAQPENVQLDALRAQLLSLSRTIRAEPVTASARVVPPAGVLATSPPATPNLALARARITAGQFIEPADDSAVFYLRQARATGENSSAVTIAATDLGMRIRDRVQQAVAASDALQAQRWLQVATDIDREFELTLPDLTLIGGQVAELNSTQARASFAEALAHAIKLRESGRLLAPGDNALERLTAIIAQNAAAPEVRAEQQRLTFTLLENARTALAAGNIDLARTLAESANLLAPGMANTKVILQQVTTAREDRDWANKVVSAASLKRIREVSSVYPRDAERQKLEGWVDVDFTIAADGSTQNLVVRNAQPANVFDKAALDALKKWRFEPVLRNGAPTPQRATLRMRFVLK